MSISLNRGYKNSMDFIWREYWSISEERPWNRRTLGIPKSSIFLFIVGFTTIAKTAPLRSPGTRCFSNLEMPEPLSFSTSYAFRTIATKVPLEL